MEKKFEYPALVRQEAKNLRKLITADERDRLSFPDLKPDSQWNCIYGQLTGSCFSDRAEELIVKSCPRVYKFDSSGSKLKGYLSKILNGKPKEGGRYKNASSTKCRPAFEETFWSPIEVFIYKEKNQKSGANKRLLSYIKREIKTL